MLKLRMVSVALAAAMGFAGAAVQAADQTVPGAGNAEAIRLAKGSPLVQSAYRMLRERLNEARSPALKRTLAELIDQDKACIRHRANVSDADKDRILAQLQAEGLVDTAAAANFPGGLKAGVFPPVLNDGSACPRLPQAFYSAPGGATFGHHSEPGGLPVHEAFNDFSALGLSNSYHMVYGHTDKNGLPVVTRQPNHEKGDNPAFVLDPDIVLLAPIMHDWAKPIVFQWNADGTEFAELDFAGNGKTDNNGLEGNSKTGAHHILGLAEAMKRGLPPDFVVTVASAHSVPTLGNEYKVVNFLRAAAIIAQIDPYQAGYLRRDAKQNPRLPAVRHLGDVDLNAAPSTQTNLLVEYVLHNLSDADFAFTGAAAADVTYVIERLAPDFGYTPGAQDYLVKYRNPVLSYLSSERLYILYSNGGLEAVRKEIAKLRKLSVI